jgi:hypothetical protein
MDSPGSAQVVNAVPESVYESRSGALTTYRDFPGPTVYTSALPERVRGGIVGVNRDNNVVVVAGTGTDLFRQVGTNWVKVSGQTYTGKETDRWEFEQFGDRIIATNYVDPIQSLEFGRRTFQPLIQSQLKPRARTMAIVRAFLVLGDLVEGGVRHPQRIRWSALDNVSDFQPSITTQSNNADLFGSGGRVQRIIGGENGIVFQESSIWSMTYTGGDDIFVIDEVASNQGTDIAGSVIAHGASIYFWGRDGFYQMDRRGGTSSSIGSNRVDRHFLRNLNAKQTHRVHASYHPGLGAIMWAYPSKDSDGTPDRLLLYRPSIDRWGEIHLSTEAIFASRKPGFTLPELDQFGRLPDLPAPLDDPRWAGGEPMLVMVDDQHRLCLLDGEPLAATIDSAETQIAKTKRAFIRNIRPIVEAPAETVIAAQVGHRNETTLPVTWTPIVPKNRWGNCPVRIDARLHRLRLHLTGNFSNLQGFEIEARATGTR